MSKGEAISAVSDVVKGAIPSATVNTMTFFGVGLSDWVYLATLGYLVVHVGYIIYKWKKGI